jgi:hypothetical protein
MPKTVHKTGKINFCLKNSQTRLKLTSISGENDSHSDEDKVAAVVDDSAAAAPPPEAVAEGEAAPVLPAADDSSDYDGPLPDGHHDIGMYQYAQSAHATI